MTVSIIIAVKEFNNNLAQCIRHCLDLDYNDHEIIIFPDKKFTFDNPKVKIIPTGNISPPRKRDFAIQYANGEILAFLDDDAYPVKNWLKNAVEHFKAENIAAVCGPGITPDADSYRQKASGLVYSCLLVSGNYIYRYLQKPKRFVQDYPSFNFLVRKSIFKTVGGFNTNFWPGEDTRLCLDIIKISGKKILYSPDVLAYHHRRALFVPHLKQIANYGLHRGYFAKKYPKTSLKITYFIPSLFSLGIIAGLLVSFHLPYLKALYLTGLFLYFIIVLIFSISKQLTLIPFVFSGIILTHFTYGFFFLSGLLSPKLSEENENNNFLPSNK